MISLLTEPRELSKLKIKAEPQTHLSTMKAPTIYTTAFTVLVGLTTEASANSCKAMAFPGNQPFIARDIFADGIPDIPGICGGLWDNMKCSVTIPNGCEDRDGTLYWYFTTTPFCNCGDVEHAWYEATKNEWGPLFCCGEGG